MVYVIFAQQKQTDYHLINFVSAYGISNYFNQFSARIQK